jgi:DNA modification methylase
LGAVKSLVLRFPQIRGSLQKKTDPLKSHPARFPVNMIEFLIESFSTNCSIIFDPFMGSGTVGIAAENTNRNWIGFELNEVKSTYNL